MNAPNIFNYSEPQSYLNDVLNFKCTKNPSFSVRAWSKQMGLKAHTSLVYLLNRQRKVRSQHIPFILKGLNLNENEAAYFGNMVHLHIANSMTEQQYYESRMKDLHPLKDFSFLDLEQFRLISNWYHVAILEMTQLKGFKNDPKWISKRLNGKISASQAKDAIDRLINLALLKEKNGNLEKTQARLMTPKNRTSESIREHHKQVLQLAIDATDKQGLDQRYYNSCAMTVDSSKMKEAVDLIISFRGQMAKLMESQKGTETYQLNVQFFNLTEGKEE